tara:strand:- start:587 stop:802 length:216 start_codon:yes stop_codon:yes gene_type:complete
MKNLKSKIKSKDLKKGMIIGWIEDGYNECEGIMIDHEIVKASSITFNSPKSSMSLISSNNLYFEKSSLELK